MHKPKLFFLISCLPLLTVLGATSTQLSNGQEIDLPANLTYPPFSPTSLNVTAHRRFFIPNTILAIDFWHQSPSIHQQDVLMCIIQGFSQIFGTDPTTTIPGLSTFYYKNLAFIHVQDLNPTVGREYTYRDLANTLRGIGEYMMLYQAFWTTEFQVWEIAPGEEVKIGSGGVGGAMGLQKTGAVSTALSAQTGTPACNRGDRHCVA